jgi:hypothetical protein
MAKANVEAVKGSCDRCGGLVFAECQACGYLLCELCVYAAMDGTGECPNGACSNGDVTEGYNTIA